MNNQDTRLYEMILRAQEYGTSQSARIPADSYAIETFTLLRQKLALLDTHATAQSSSKRAVAESSANKEAARKKLRAKIEAISRTAKPMGKTTPGVADKFRIPTRLKDQDLLSFARSVANDAAPHKAEFVKRGLSASFIEELSDASASFEGAVSRHIQSTEARVTSTATVKMLLQERLALVRGNRSVVFD